MLQVLAGLPHQMLLGRCTQRHVRLSCVQSTSALAMHFANRVPFKVLVYFQIVKEEEKFTRNEMNKLLAFVVKSMKSKVRNQNIPSTKKQRKSPRSYNQKLVSKFHAHQCILFDLLTLFYWWFYSQLVAYDSKLVSTRSMITKMQKWTSAVFSIVKI